MWGIVDRAAKAAADLTVGTVIVLVHVALASRNTARRPQLAQVVGRSNREHAIAALRE